MLNPVYWENKKKYFNVLFAIKIYLACQAIIANDFPEVNNMSFVCLKHAMFHEVCHIRYKSMGMIIKSAKFVIYNAQNNE